MGLRVRAETPRRRHRPQRAIATHSHLGQNGGSQKGGAVDQLVRTLSVTMRVPVSTGELEAAESVLLHAMRGWIADRRNRRDPWPRLRSAFRRAGAETATPILDPLMEIIVGTASRCAMFNDPRRPFLSEDEHRLLRAASLSQAGETRAAVRELRPDLLLPAGALIVAGLFSELGEVFADAGLLFRQWTVH